MRLVTRIPNIGCAIMTHMGTNRATAGAAPSSPCHAAPTSAGSAVIVFLLALAGSAWLVTARLATADMRLGVLTGTPEMSMGSQMGAAGQMPLGVGAFIGAWTLMMVAMMVPSVLPAVRALDSRTYAIALLFVAGYLLVWSAVGGAAYVALRVLQVWLPAGNTTAIRGGAALVVVAGVYQLLPLKSACLRHCQPSQTGEAPQAMVAKDECYGALRTGLAHGIACLGSSWALMLVLLLLGMMNLAWMGVVAGAIFVEKVVPGGIAFGKAVGLGLVGVGIILVGAPHPLPALGG